MTFGHHRLVRLLWNQTNVFYYRTSYVGRYSRFIYKHNKPYGVEHEDDVQYLLELRDFSTKFIKNDPEMKMVDRMTRFWANFAINGYTWHR